MNKAELRAEMTRIMKDIGAADLAERSARVARRLGETEAWRRADVVLCFLSMPHELETAEMIRAARAEGKTVAVPWIEGNNIRFLLLPEETGSLARDRWGISVPDPSWAALDPARAARPLVAAPGLAFDRSGHRLGRGKGYYDRFLAHARPAARGLSVIGVCLSEQLLDAVPHSAGDQRVDGIVTDAETMLLA